MGRWLFGLETVKLPLPCNEEFDTTCSRTPATPDFSAIVQWSLTNPAPVSNSNTRRYGASAEGQERLPLDHARQTESGIEIARCNKAFFEYSLRKTPWPQREK